LAFAEARGDAGHCRFRRLKTLRYRGKAKVDLQNQCIGAAYSGKRWPRLLAQ